MHETVERSTGSARVYGARSYSLGVKRIWMLIHVRKLHLKGNREKKPHLQDAMLGREWIRIVRANHPFNDLRVTFSLSKVADTRAKQCQRHGRAGLRDSALSNVS